MAPGAGTRRRRAGRLFRRGATWYGRLRVAGREQTRSLHTGDRAEAARRLQAWSDAQHAARFEGPRHTWEEAIQRWETEIAPGLKPNTAERYRVSLWQLDRHLSHAAVAAISLKRIAELVSARRKAGAANATINRDLTALGSVLGACAAWDWIAEDPTQRFDRKRLTREIRDPIRIPSDVDVAAVIARAPNGFSDLIAFLAETGMRQEEAAGLEWADVSPDRATVTLTRTKTSRARALILRREARAILKRRPRHLTSPVVFWHDDGARYTTVPGRFRVIVSKVAQAAVKAGRPFNRFRCHDLRHKFAVDRLREGWDIYVLARYLGHSTVKVTERYLGYVPGGAPIGRGDDNAPIAPPVRGTNGGTKKARGTAKRAKKRASSKR